MDFLGVATERCKKHVPFVKLSDWPSHGLVPKQEKKKD
jgi:hypothetical protein